MAAQHSRYGDYSTRYKFNGKEQDEATGFYYYGARYYAPSLSRWLSVDPLAEKYQGFSPYNYTLNNPIMLVDPDGRSVETDFINKSTGEHVYIDDGNDQIVFTNNSDWNFIKNMSTADTWCFKETNKYFEIIDSGLLDFKSDLGILTRLAYTEMNGKGLPSNRIAAESVYNRAKYNGKYANKYNPQLQASLISQVVKSKGAYAQTPNKEQFKDPYKFINKFGSEYRNKFARPNLAASAYAAYLTINKPSEHIGKGVLFYHSYYLKDSKRAWNYLTKNQAPYANRAGDLKNLNINSNGIGAAATLLK